MASDMLYAKKKAASLFFTRSFYGSAHRCSSGNNLQLKAVNQLGHFFGHLGNGFRISGYLFH